jgi:hypothetical protein
MRMGVLLLLASLATLCACGGEQTDEPAPAGHFHGATLAGLGGVSGVCVAGTDLLLVRGGEDRTLYAVARADLVPDRRDVPVRRLEVSVRREAPLGGSEPLALQGYRLGHFWDLDLDLSCVALRPPASVYLGERRFRLVFYGRLYRDAAGRATRVDLDGAFVAAGARRDGADAGDWSDHGPGMASLQGSQHSDQTEDLALLERDAPSGDHFRVIRLDRMGSRLGEVRVDVAGEAPEVRGLSFSDERYLVLRGAGRGALAPFPDPRRKARATLGAGTPAPEPLSGAWSALAHAEDGTLYLASGGDPCRIAWRGP